MEGDFEVSLVRGQESNTRPAGKRGAYFTCNHTCSIACNRISPRVLFSFFYPNPKASINYPTHVATKTDSSHFPLPKIPLPSCVTQRPSFFLFPDVALIDPIH